MSSRIVNLVSMTTSSFLSQFVTSLDSTRWLTVALPHHRQHHHQRYVYVIHFTFVLSCLVCDETN